MKKTKLKTNKVYKARATKEPMGAWTVQMTKSLYDKFKSKVAGEGRTLQKVGTEFIESYIGTDKQKKPDNIVKVTRTLERIEKEIFSIREQLK